MAARPELLMRLRIEKPIIQAGMAGGITTPELVAEVTKAGGLGTIGAGYMHAENLRSAIQRVKKQTEGAFAVNVFVPETPEVVPGDVQKANEKLSLIHKKLNLDSAPVPEKLPSFFEEQLEVVIEEKIEICSFTFGLPSPEQMKRLKAHGVFLIGTATSVEEAARNEQAGMDAVVAQGSEAGGHRGTFAESFEKAMVGTMALVPQVVDKVDIPVIAAGGIMDGRGVLAAHALGAEAVQMGTAFLTCRESGAPPAHQQAVLTSKETDTAITTIFSGKPARGITNKMMAWMEALDHKWPPYPVQNMLTQPIRREAARQNESAFMSLWSGQGTRLSVQEPAAAMIKRLMEEAEEAWESL
ncbi:nitronate monooxygenase [Marinococcus halophilus]|uniref:Probable nitronate monooxygenase n=1 Tax=Marinococcus halophilus TaxID=1371 RepID=A0A510Y983_MARHA|nr:nitronate monooxygenase [Marinococcus halophilus]OZT80609.1 nitronate monooxygenase [Marinococcus halophilus]GEK58967.1 putative nitronate monooxygenase [Marinococcus halophilus]